jgi:hypothetical protein
MQIFKVMVELPQTHGTVKKDNKMSTQNIFSGLADQKTYKDFQNEQIAQDLAKQQLLNAQQTNRAGQMGIDETIRKQGIANQIRDIGASSVTTDELGNKTLDKKALTNSLYAIDPLQASSFEAENAKTAKDLATAGADAKIKQIQQHRETLGLTKDFYTQAIQGLGGIQDEAGFNAYRDQQKAQADALGISNQIDKWSFANKNNLINQGLTSVQQLEQQQKETDNYIKQQELGIKQGEYGIKQQEAQQKQSGVLPPAEQQKAISDFRSQRLSQKNAIKADEKESALSGLNSFFGKDKDGKIKYRYANSPSVGTYDTKLIINSIKADDPTSTVSETEVKTAKGTEPWFITLSQDLKDAVSKVSKNSFLSDNQRLAIYNSANNKIKEQRKTLEDLDTPIINQIKSQGLDPSLIFTPKEIKRYGLDKANASNTKTPTSPFSFRANVPPPAYTAQPIIADSQGNQVPLGNKPSVVNPNQTEQQNTTPKIALPAKFTELSMEQRKAIQGKAKAKGYTPQEYFNLLRGG